MEGVIIMDSTQYNNKLTKLLEDKNTYRFSKSHKPEIPLRHIISCVGSALHKITKPSTKICTPLLGTISNSYVKISGDLLNMINDIYMKNIYLARLDIKSLYTNILVSK